MLFRRLYLSIVFTSLGLPLALAQQPIKKTNDNNDKEVVEDKSTDDNADDADDANKAPPAINMSIWKYVPADDLFSSQTSYAIGFGMGTPGNIMEGSSKSFQLTSAYHLAMMGHKLDAGLFYRLTMGKATNTVPYTTTGYQLVEKYGIKAQSMGVGARMRVWETKYGALHGSFATGITFTSSKVSESTLEPIDEDPDYPGLPDDFVGAQRAIGTKVPVAMSYPIIMAASWEYRMPRYAVGFELGSNTSGLTINESFSEIYGAIYIRLFQKEWVMPGSQKNSEPESEPAPAPEPEPAPAPEVTTELNN